MVDLGIELSEDTLITSKTDLKGNIVYCNKDFIKYSGYTELEVFGKPHNVVRHADMPRAVFKYLWDYIRDEKEIFAFVKNKTKDGGHYWVFANVTPSFDMSRNIIGYYSVRRKPNAKAIETISQVYAQMRTAEKNSIKHSSEILENILNDYNMPYNQFIISMQQNGSVEKK